MNEKIYLDNAATTYVSGEVLNEMLPCFSTIYGNASSLHNFGREAMGIVDRARDRIAKAINAKMSNEIYFTSGGTEANNWAIMGLALANRNKGNHIITTAIEHESVLASCKSLEQMGFEITYLPVDQYGLASLADLMHNIKTETILISMMSVNNEIGTIQNIKAIGKTAHEHGIIFHTDAVQAVGALKLDVQDMEIDAMTMSGHKIYGPKGIGALYIKNGIKINNLIYGGSQERNKRGGTINVPSIAGFGKAVEIATRDLAVNQQKIKTIRTYFLEQVNEKIPYVKLNGHPLQKVQGIVNLSFEMIDGESLLMLLDLDGIAVSTGSACTAGLAETSHVLQALGLGEELARGAIRFSFGKMISKEKVDFVIDKLVKSVAKLRKISPVTKTGGNKK
ncbi:MAG: cysteine desulfurase family protein [Clostridia bacterium]|nr:cysteine desulfurase family protein [Clostridia bacterium]MDD4686130.1 cysteine desulfurase family protein [Clostridia bacterium]